MSFTNDVKLISLNRWNKVPEWDALVQAVVGVGPAKYIHASDHCSNMSNVGACKKSAAKTDEALVERITPGSRPAFYLVL